MKTIQIQSQLPFDALLDSLQQLSAEELEQVTQQASRLRAQRKTPHLSEVESDLLTKINRGIVPPALQQRCADLTEKQRTDGLSATEQAELMGLVDEIEQLNAERLGYLVQLAQLRQVSVDELMQRLEIKPLSYG